MNKNSAIIFFLIFAFLILNMSIVFGQEYYADIIIDVNERGETTISGITNNLDILGTFNEFTSKNDKYWLFNLSKNNFSDVIFKVYFPKNTVLTYIKSSAQISIGSESDITYVKGILKNKPLEIVVQYYFEEEVSDKPNWFMLLLFFSFIILGAYLLFIYKSRKEKFYFLSESISNRQNMIMDLLIKKDGITQKEVEQKLSLPKSSISRNVASLEKKELIIKVNKGHKNVLFLNRKKYK